MYICLLIGSILFGIGGYVFYKLDKRAKMEGKWWQDFWCITITVWTGPLYTCFFAELVCLYPLLDLMF